jgi:hypothetical protein
MPDASKYFVMNTDSQARAFGWTVRDRCWSDQRPIIGDCRTSITGHHFPNKMHADLWRVGESSATYVTLSIAERRQPRAVGIGVQQRKRDPRHDEGPRDFVRRCIECLLICWNKSGMR